MKRIVALTLVGAMALSLTACGASNKKTEMTFAWWGNQTRTENTEAALDVYTEKHPNVTFDTQAYQWSDYWTALSTNAAGGQLPGIIQQDYAYIEQYVAANQLVDLTPYIENGKIDSSNVADSVMDTGKVDGKVYAICAGVNAPALYYNKTLTDSLGVTIPDNMTMDQFRAIGQEIYEKSGIRTSWGYGPQENFITYWVRGEGYKSFYSSDKFTFESADVIKPFFEYIANGVNEGWLMDATIYADIDYTAVEQQPMVYYTSEANQSWCAPLFSNQMVALVNAAPEGMEVGITTWPSNNPSASNYIKPSQFFSISRDCKDVDVAVDVLNFLTNDEDVNINCLKAERGIPISSVVANAVAPSLSETQQKVIAYINNVATPNSTTIFPPLPGKSSQANVVIGEAVEQIMYGKITPEEAANKVFEEGNKILGE